MLLPMCNDNAPGAASSAPLYQIRLGGELGPEWADWFDGMAITPAGDGDTLLTGELPDQPALYGVLHKLRDLGLPLLALYRLEPAPQLPDAEGEIS